MPLSSALSHRLSAELRDHMGAPVTITGDLPVGGGSINDAFRLDTDAGRFFLKTNSADRFPSMFEAEADGLRRLRVADALQVPEVIASGEEEDTTYLLLKWMEAAPRRPTFWADLGRGLAKLHGNISERFGLDRSNYIGSLVQVNTPHASWDEFYVHCRLGPQVKLARDEQRIGMGDVLRFERLYGELSLLFPIEPPALLHGDLWRGNFLAGPEGGPVLIDPAVYYGHREMDMAMTKLFGGFEPEFYSAYNSAWPMEKGWEERMDLCNLYPLLVHVNLFGGGYVTQLQQVLKRFV